MDIDEFISTVQERAELEDRSETSDLVAIVLETFSEILYRTERDKLSASLPKGLASHLHAAPAQTSRQQVERYPSAEFLNRIQARADQNLSEEEAHTLSAHVFAVLTDAIGPALLSKVVDKLPAGYDSLFPFSDTTSSGGPTV